MNNCYGLPKFHKSKRAKVSVETQKLKYKETRVRSNLDLRYQAHHAPLGKILDILRQPFLYQLKSYFRNDINF